MPCLHYRAIINTEVTSQIAFVDLSENAFTKWIIAFDVKIKSAVFFFALIFITYCYCAV